MGLVVTPTKELANNIVCVHSLVISRWFKRLLGFRSYQARCYGFSIHKEKFQVVCVDPEHLREAKSQATKLKNKQDQAKRQLVLKNARFNSLLSGPGLNVVVRLSVNI